MRSSGKNSFSEKALVVVHPGSLCGSLGFNLGKLEAQAVRDGIDYVVATHKGPIVGVMGNFNDEIPQYKIVQRIVDSFTEVIFSCPSEHELVRAGKYIRKKYGDNVVTGAWGDVGDGCAYILAKASGGILDDSVATTDESGEEDNPPKLDKVVVRYAERVYDDLIEAISSGKLVGKALYVSPPGVIATRGEWQYALQWEDQKIDLIVDSRSIGGQTFVPDDKKKPIRMVVRGWETPSKVMFVHEFVHYLQSKHGLLAKLEHHTSVADYLDHPNERDAYFIQFLSEEILPKLRFNARMRTKDPERAEASFKKMFGTKKAITARVGNYFKASGHWKEMKPQTQKHYIDRLTAYIEYIHGS